MPSTNREGTPQRRSPGERPTPRAENLDKPGEFKCPSVDGKDTPAMRGVSFIEAGQKWFSPFNGQPDFLIDDDFRDGLKED
jgi:hypothetical protein